MGCINAIKGDDSGVAAAVDKFAHMLETRKENQYDGERDKMMTKPTSSVSPERQPQFLRPGLGRSRVKRVVMNQNDPRERVCLGMCAWSYKLPQTDPKGLKVRCE